MLNRSNLWQKYAKKIKYSSNRKIISVKPTLHNDIHYFNKTNCFSGKCEEKTIYDPDVEEAAFHTAIGPGFLRTHF